VRQSFVIFYLERDEEEMLTYLLWRIPQQEVSPRTSGRLSHSSGPLNGTQSCGSLTDSPPVSPSEIDDIKVHTSCIFNF